MSVLAWAFALYGVLTLTAMAPMSLGAAVLILAFAWSWFRGRARSAPARELRRPASKRYAILSTVLAAACALSLIAAIVDPLSYGGHISEIHFFSDIAKLWYLFWPLLLAIILRTLSAQERSCAWRAWLVAFGVLGLLGITQYFTGWPGHHAIPGTQHFHATLFLGHHLSVASILIFPFFAALDALRKKRGGKAFFILAVLLGGATLILTYSRTLWVALPLGAAAWALSRLPRKQALIGALGLALIVGAATKLPFVEQRMGMKMGIVEREDLWQANWEFFKARPVLGVGWRHNQELSGYYLMEKKHKTDVFSGHAHNDLLDQLAGTGALGALAWIAWCAFVILLAWRIPQARWLVFAWLVFHMNGLTQVNFWEGKVLHQISWTMGWLLFWAGEA